jgi:hypothetical protein
MNTAFGTAVTSTRMPLPARARSQARHAPRVVRRAYRELASSPDTAPAHTSVGPQLLLALSHGSLFRLEHSTCISRPVVHLHPYAHARSRVKRVLIRFIMSRYTSTALEV